MLTYEDSCSKASASHLIIALCCTVVIVFQLSPKSTADESDSASALLAKELPGVRSLEQATPSELSILKSNSAKSIAIAAAWECTRRKALEISPKPNYRSDFVRNGELAGTYFVGFIEGRLQCSAPNWWKRQCESVRSRAFVRIVEESRFSEEDLEQVTFAKFPDLLYRQLGGASLWCAKNLQVNGGRNSVSIIGIEQEFDLTQIVDKVPKGFWHSAVSGVRASDDSTILVIHPSDWRGLTQIACFEKTGRRRWRTELDVPGGGGGSSGTGVINRISLQSVAGSAYLFGADAEAIYLIEVREDSGKAECLFVSHL